MSEELTEAEREAHYLENITKRKQQKFASKTFGGGLEAAREGKVPTSVHHHGSPQPVHQPVQQHSVPTSPVNHGPAKKWTVQESVHQEPINRPTSPRSYGEIDTTSMISKRADDDIEEALRREEERMNKKLSHTAPVGSVHVGGLQPVNSPERRTGGSQTFSSPSNNQPSKSYSANYSKPTPVHAQQQQPGCSCGHISPQGTKFCPECGKPANTGPSSPNKGYVQNSQPTGRFGEIDSTPMIHQRDNSDIEEALRKEEERMNKKLGNTAHSGNFGGGSPGLQKNHPQHEPFHPVQQHSAPVHSPVHAQPKYHVSENIVEEIVAPVQNLSVGMKGAGVFCTYEIPGDAAGGDRPKMNVDQQTSSYVFTPVASKSNCTVECLIEGTDLLKFKLTTSQGGTIVQKYSMPFPIGREMLKRKGSHSIELDPF